MIKILNFKKIKRKGIKIYSLRAAGSCSSLPLASFLHLLNNSGKQADSVIEMVLRIRTLKENCLSFPKQL